MTSGPSAMGALKGPSWPCGFGLSSPGPTLGPLVFLSDMRFCITHSTTALYLSYKATLKNPLVERKSQVEPAL